MISKTFQEGQKEKMESDKLCLDSTCKLETGELVQDTGLFPRKNVSYYGRGSVFVLIKKGKQRDM